MKKILLLCLFLSIGVYSYADIFGYGIKAGLNYGKMSNVSLGDNNSRAGFHVGLFLNAKFAFIGVQPELLFSQQVTKLETDLGGSTTLRTNYLNIPIMVQWRVVPNIFYIELGPQMGILITDNFKNDLQTVNIKDLNTFDLSIAAGLGVKIPMLPLGFNARYCFGLTEAAEHRTGDKKSRNNVFQIGAFWEF